MLPSDITTKKPIIGLIIITTTTLIIYNGVTISFIILFLCPFISKVPDCIQRHNNWITDHIQSLETLGGAISPPSTLLHINTIPMKLCHTNTCAVCRTIQQIKVIVKSPYPGKNSPKKSENQNILSWNPPTQAQPLARNRKTETYIFIESTIQVPTFFKRQISIA